MTQASPLPVLIQPGPRNSLADVAGLLVGNAEDLNTLPGSRSCCPIARIGSRDRSPTFGSARTTDIADGAGTLGGRKEFERIPTEQQDMKLGVALVKSD